MSGFVMKPPAVEGKLINKALRGGNYFTLRPLLPQQEWKQTVRKQRTRKLPQSLKLAKLFLWWHKNDSRTDEWAQTNPSLSECNYFPRTNRNESITD